MVVLPQEAFSRIDENNDDLFYAAPRFVTHIDEAAIAQVTALYRTYLSAGGVVLDLMSSWVSHLPAEVSYAHIIGQGMNEEELMANPRLDEYLVQDLNRHPILPYLGNAFDGVACCVSVQYLTQPIVIFREVARLLKRDAPFIITFSNRCFPSKAVRVWLNLDDLGHLRLVEHYFAQAEAFRKTVTFQWRPKEGDPLYAVVGFAR